MPPFSISPNLASLEQFGGSERDYARYLVSCCKRRTIQKLIPWLLHQLAQQQSEKLQDSQGVNVRQNTISSWLMGFPKTEQEWMVTRQESGFHSEALVLQAVDTMLGCPPTVESPTSADSLQTELINYAEYAANTKRDQNIEKYTKLLFLLTCEIAIWSGHNEDDVDVAHQRFLFHEGRKSVQQNELRKQRKLAKWVVKQMEVLWNMGLYHRGPEILLLTAKDLHFYSKCRQYRQHFTREVPLCAPPEEVQADLPLWPPFIIGLNGRWTQHQISQALGTRIMNSGQYFQRWSRTYRSRTLRCSAPYSSPISRQNVHDEAFSLQDFSEPAIGYSTAYTLSDGGSNLQMNFHEIGLRNMARHDVSFKGTENASSHPSTPPSIIPEFSASGTRSPEMDEFLATPRMLATDVTLQPQNHSSDGRFDAAQSTAIFADTNMNQPTVEPDMSVLQWSPCQLSPIACHDELPQRIAGNLPPQTVHIAPDGQPSNAQSYNAVDDSFLLGFPLGVFHPDTL